MGLEWIRRSGTGKDPINVLARLNNDVLTRFLLLCEGSSGDRWPVATVQSIASGYRE